MRVRIQHVEAGVKGGVTEVQIGLEIEGKSATVADFKSVTVADLPWARIIFVMICALTKRERARIWGLTSKNRCAILRSSLGGLREASRHTAEPSVFQTGGSSFKGTGQQ